MFDVVKERLRVISHKMLCLENTVDRIVSIISVQSAGDDRKKDGTAIIKPVTIEQNFNYSIGKMTDIDTRMADLLQALDRVETKLQNMVGDDLADDADGDMASIRDGYTYDEIDRKCHLAKDAKGRR